MAENTNIEWAHHTFNHVRGCTKVSEECDHCYADTLSARNPASLGIWGKHGTRAIAAESYWKLPYKWNRMAEILGERHRVFCASLADVFEGDSTMPTDSIQHVWEARERLFHIISQTKNLDWLLLTKRPNFVKNIMADLAWNGGGLNDFPNVWLGTSVGVRKTKDRIDYLRGVPAKVRFLSCEPLLEDLGELDLNGIDRVIVGGESGANARPMHPDWVRSIRDQCQSAGVPFFFKQWGEYRPVSSWDMSDDPIVPIMTVNEKKSIAIGLDGDIRWKTDDDPVPEETAFKNRYYVMENIGKKNAGRKLDGREWNEMPEVSEDER